MKQDSSIQEVNEDLGANLTPADEVYLKVRNEDFVNILLVRFFILISFKMDN